MFKIMILEHIHDAYHLKKLSLNMTLFVIKVKKYKQSSIFASFKIRNQLYLLQKHFFKQF
jgi:hypothetical protein